MDYRCQPIIPKWMMMVMMTTVVPALHIYDVTWCQQLTSVYTGSSSFCLCAPPAGVVPVSSKHFQAFQVFSRQMVHKDFYLCPCIFFFKYYIVMFCTSISVDISISISTEIHYFLTCKPSQSSSSGEKKTGPVCSLLYFFLCLTHLQVPQPSSVCISLPQLWVKPWEEDPEFKEEKKLFNETSIDIATVSVWQEVVVSFVVSISFVVFA